VEMIIKEFVRHFELHVTEETQASTLQEEENNVENPN